MGQATDRWRALVLAPTVAALVLTACSNAPVGTTPSPVGPLTADGSAAAAQGGAVVTATPAAAGRGRRTRRARGAAVVEPTAEILLDDGHLRIVEADGTNGRVAVPSVDAAGDDHAIVRGDWSPDGRQVSFTRLRRGPEPLHASVWVARTDGSGAREVVRCATPCQRAGMAAWSPNGHELVYAVTEAGRHSKPLWRNAVEVVSVTSGRRRVVVETEDPRTELASPRWSPDGRKVVVQMRRRPEPGAGTTEPTPASPVVAIVELARPRTQTPRILTPQLPGTDPDWGWKTDRIVFSTNDPDDAPGNEAGRNLWTVRPDGSGLRRVTHFPPLTMAVHPTWTRDGDIVFEYCQVVPACFVAYANADGSVVQTPQKLAGAWPRLRPAR